MTAPSDFNSIPELDATLVFCVAYDGSSYSGFAEQPGQTTVAGELRRAIETLLRRPIDLTCAGRTDAGVHAVAQYISVPVTDAELALTRRRWLRAMDALLPKDIAINEVYKARRGFSARFDARSRTYTYRIADRDARPVLSRGAVWWHRSVSYTHLDVYKRQVGSLRPTITCPPRTMRTPSPLPMTVR